MTRPINADPVAVVLYGPDPRGWAMFARLSGMLQRGMNGTSGTVIVGEKSEPGRAFYGYMPAAPRASAVGLAPLGSARIIPPGDPDFVHARSDGILDDSAMRIFAQRLARRSS